MKRQSRTRFLTTLVLMISMLTPLTAFAVDGKGHFKEGMKYETAEQWDKAAEEFALAVSSNPKNPEYKLHLARALFNASQMFIKKGTIAANEKDYEGAYNAFRRAYAFDPTNDFAKSEMDRMVRLQQGVVGGKDAPGGTATPGGQVGGNVNLVPTGYVNASTNQIPQKLERLRDVPFPGGVDLQFIIKELAKDLDLNVLFDSESRLENRKVKIELHNVTSAKALDYIFLQEGLFFQKVGPRTIIVANQTQRTKFQQLVLRTFYLANASPKDVAKVVQTAIPAQPGRSQTIVLTDDATNSITIRDTSENIRLIGQLIHSLDKDRAEVVMDVAIYEVNKTDLLQFGNQIGTAQGTGTNLNNIGGVGFPFIRNGGSSTVSKALGFALPGALGIGVALPTSQIAALQARGDTKLLASTQIHAFNNEDSSARIGQRVPVRSATFQTGAVAPGTTAGNGVVSDVINYEQVGLTLKFKPLVFPNQDVQVAMEIESKDVAGAQTLTPTFTERTIKGTARVQNNKTLLLASVAQDVETHGRQGLPLLGLIPILGRLFTAPTKDNRQVDIVIAVTPRVIRAPAILPEDETEMATGSLAVPTNSSLEAMIVEEDREENIAAARRLPNAASVQLPDQAPQYVKSDASALASTTAPINSTATASTQPPTFTAQRSGPQIKPIENSVRSLQLTDTGDAQPQMVPSQSAATDNLQATAAKPNNPQLALARPDSVVPAVNSGLSASQVGIGFGGAFQNMKKGEIIKVPVLLYGSGNLSSAVVGLKFDSKKVAVKSISYGEVFGATANTPATPFLNQDGKMYVSVTSPTGIPASGVLVYIEFEALANGKPVVTFDRDVLNLLALDGKTVALTMQE
jgi:general secretion pathway protein D